MFSLSPCIQRTGWLLLLVAMAVVGITQMRGLHGLRSVRVSADATSEAVFAAVTGEREVPRRLSAEVEKLPPGRPLLVLQPRDNVLTSLPSMMLAYEFCNRHPVIRELQVADSPAAVEELRKLFAAVFFVGQAPPAAFPPGQRFGAMIVLVPLVSAAP